MVVLLTQGERSTINIRDRQGAVSTPDVLSSMAGGLPLQYRRVSPASCRREHALSEPKGFRADRG